MSKDDGLLARTDPALFRGGSNLPPLPANILDHLGQHLRFSYYETSELPRYVGDPALPAEFDPYLDRLYRRERDISRDRTGQAGLRAVASALAA